MSNERAEPERFPAALPSGERRRCELAPDELDAAASALLLAEADVESIGGRGSHAPALQC